jgi:hypothetical protein
VTLCSAALGVAISQACYAIGKNHERAVLRQLLGELDLEGVLIQATLRSMAFNAVRLEGIWWITEGIAALANDIKGLLRLLG